MTADVAVVVVSWNGRHWLERCLPPLLGQTGVEFEVIVVDNGSDDGTIDWLAASYPAVRRIANRENRGFAAANNQGIEASDSPFVALLNNDALAEPEWLIALRDGIGDAGSAASLMVRLDTPAIVDSAGIAPDRLGFAWNLAAGQPASGVVDGPVFGACAGAALYRRALFEDIGLFDETFGSYYEDVDLAWRARWRGWDSLLITRSVVRHAHSATGGAFPARKRFLLGRNRLWTIVKNHPRPAALLGGLPVELAAVRSPAALAGRLAAVAGLPRALRARRRILEGRIVEWPELDRLRAPLGG